MSRQRVTITGVGAVTPLGNGARILYEGWKGGRSGIQDGLGRCTEFNPELVLSKKEIRRSDRFTQLAIAAADEAMKQAGWDDGLPYEPERIGCVVGSAVGGICTFESQYEVLRDRGERAISALVVPMFMSNAAASVISMRYGLTGPSWSVVSACATGSHAIGNAVRLLQSGEVDAIVTGGAEASMTSLATAAFACMGATSRKGLSCPFDARRDGFVYGEGAGMLVLENAEAAQARGTKPLAEVLGYGASSDAFHLTAPRPGGEGAARAIALCLSDAGITADDLHWINAHGTSTQLNDRAETNAIKLALGKRAYQTPISAPKSAIGHLMGAGGAVEAVATVLALNARVAPPTLNYVEPEDGLDLDYVPNFPRALPDRQSAERVIGISNSFGFGGHNAVLCFAAR